jgi:hypothetical protein
MSKAGKRILASVRKARAFARGETGKGFVVHVPDKVDVRAPSASGLRSLARNSPIASASRLTP